MFSHFPLKTVHAAISHLFAPLSHRHMLELSCHVAFGELQDAPDLLYVAPGRGGAARWGDGMQAGVPGPPHEYLGDWRGGREGRGGSGISKYTCDVQSC